MGWYVKAIGEFLEIFLSDIFLCTSSCSGSKMDSGCECSSLNARALSYLQDCFQSAPVQLLQPTIPTRSSIGRFWSILRPLPCTPLVLEQPNGSLSKLLIHCAVPMVMTLAYHYLRTAEEGVLPPDDAL